MLGPKAWTALKLGKPQALTELSESRPSEPGGEVKHGRGAWQAVGGRQKALSSFIFSEKEFEQCIGVAEALASLLAKISWVGAQAKAYKAFTGASA